MNKKISAFLISLVFAMGVFSSVSIVVAENYGAYNRLGVETNSFPVDGVVEAESTAESVSAVGSSGDYTKYVYGTDSNALTKYQKHCKDAGGVFNTCGSLCNEGEVCLAVCAYTCENIPIKIKENNNVEGSLGAYHIDSDLEIKGSNDGSVGVVASDGTIKKVELTPAEAIVKAFGPETKEVEIKLEEKEYNNVPAVVYKVNGEHEGKFLGVFKMTTKYEASVDAETGDVLDWSGPWWSFLISGGPDEPIVKEKVVPTNPVGVLD